jgi:hypothetical protein
VQQLQRMMLGHVTPDRRAGRRKQEATYTK